MSWDKELNLKQLDETLTQFKELRKTSIPSSGWINTIRKSLGMSGRSLGEKVGLSQPRIALIEKGEIDSSISLKTLEKVAQGLGCKFIYVFVPDEDSLQTLRVRQAYKKASALNQYTETHMELEEQATGTSFRQESIKYMAEEYLRKWPRNFWDDI